MASSTEHNARIHDRSRSATVEAVMITMATVGSVVTMLRFVARKQSKIALWWDDWLALASCVTVVFLCSIGVAEARVGLGLHISQIPNPEVSLPRYLKLLYHAGWTYNLGLALAKFSVLLFYARIFTTTKKLRLWLWYTGWLIVAWFIPMTMALWLQCVPVQAFWNPSIKATCIKSWPLYMCSSITSIILDVILLIIPLPIVSRLHMPSAKKTWLIALFLLGYMNPISSLVRLGVLSTIKHRMRDPDITWAFVDLSIWSVVEVSVAMTSASVPPLNALFSRHSWGHQRPFAVSGSLPLSNPTNHRTRVESGRESAAFGNNGPYHHKFGYESPSYKVDASARTDAKYGMPRDSLCLENLPDSAVHVREEICVNYSRANTPVLT